MKIKRTKLQAIILLISQILLVNSYSIDLPWKKPTESKRGSIEELLRQIEDLKSENEKYKLSELEIKKEHEESTEAQKQKTDKLSTELIELQSSIKTTTEALRLKDADLLIANNKAKEASDLQIKLLSAHESLKAKESEVQSQILAREQIEGKLKEILNKIPRHILKKHGISTTPDTGPDMFGRVRTVLSVLIFSLFLFIILLAISHSHRKGDFISWLNQKVWGKKVVSTISQYGIVFFCVYEIAVNIPTVMVIVDKVLNWIVMGT